MNMQDYRTLSDEIRKCTKCLLCATRNFVVVDRGDPSSKLMLIGEGPGANEDATGEAFVGRAGIFLDELLRESGIKSFLAVNVLKCRPPNNKFPGDDGSHFGAEVVSECLPWLDQQIAIVQPRVIVMVGGKSASYTIYRGRKMPQLKEIVGKRIRSVDYAGIDLFMMYHPAYMLRLRNQDRLKFDEVRENTISLLRAAQSLIDGSTIDTPIVWVSRQPDTGEQLTFFW